MTWLPEQSADERCLERKEGKTLDLLVERASHGDEDAFEELATAHLPGLYRAALALVGPSDARDVTQEVLMTAWRELPRLRKPQSFASWLRRILLNRCRNHYRASARREAATLRLAEEWRSETASHPGFQRLELSEALEHLPLPQRTVIALHYLAGLSIRDVAEALAVPTGTVQSRLHTGLASLRKALEEPA